MNSDLDFIEIIASKQKTDLDDSLKTENIKFYSITAEMRAMTNQHELIFQYCCTYKLGVTRMWVFMVMRIYLWQRQTFQCWWQLWQWGALIIRHGHQSTLGNMRDGDQFPSWASCLLFIFSNMDIYFAIMIFWMMMRRGWCGPLILMFSRGVFNVFCSIAHYKCFSFNREYLFT